MRVRRVRQVRKARVSLKGWPTHFLGGKTIEIIRNKVNKDSRENECHERWGFFSKFKVYDYFHFTLSIFMTFSAFTNKYNNLFLVEEARGVLDCF